MKKEINNEIFHAIKAVPRKNEICLPVLHIVVYYKNYMYVGHCLDFDIWAYSGQKNPDRALENIFKRICEIYFLQVITLYKNESLDSLFVNKQINSREWSIFPEYNTSSNIKALIDSWDRFGFNIKNRQGRPASGEYCLINPYQDLFNSLEDILKKIQNSVPSAAKEIVNDLIVKMTESYSLDLVV